MESLITISFPSIAMRTLPMGPPMQKCVLSLLKRSELVRAIGDAHNAARVVITKWLRLCLFMMWLR